MGIVLQDVDKYFSVDGRPVQVLSQISLTVERGERVALLGPSGCGKSTILGLVAGFFGAEQGQVRVDGKVSMMPQQDMLLPWRRILANALLPLELRGEDTTNPRRQAEKLLPLFGLEGFAQSYPGQLSGGMRQRASLLRAYLNGGDYWLLDEPFGKLDALTKEELQNWLLEVWQVAKPGMLFVTHDMSEAVKLAQRIYLLSSRPGRISDTFQVDWSLDDPQAEEKSWNLLQAMKNRLFGRGSRGQTPTSMV